MKILSFGEILWDVYPESKYIGGAPFNFAAHLAKHGESAYMLSAVGDDALGREAEAALSDMGVLSVYLTKRADKPTGQCLVSLDGASVPSYRLLSDVAYDYIDTDGVADGFDALYFGTLALRSSHNFRSLQALLEKHRYKEIFCDVNIRPPFSSKEAVTLCLDTATLLKISLEELSTVASMIGVAPTKDYASFAKALAAQHENLSCIIVTLGAEGAYAYDSKAKREYTVASRTVSVASTVGAGDSFSAAFLHRYLQKCGLRECMEYANAVAEYVVTQMAAVPDYVAEDFA